MSKDSINIKIVGAASDDEGMTHVINNSTDSENVFCVSFKDDPDGKGIERDVSVFGGFSQTHITAVVLTVLEAFGVDAVSAAFEELYGELKQLKQGAENTDEQ